MSVPLNNLTDTWNASGTTFTAIRMNVTNTASAAGSKLLDLQVGGASQFSVGPTGNTALSGSLSVNSTLAVPIIGPQGPDGTAALKITQANLSTAIMTFDTTNRRIGINKAASLSSNFDLDVNGGIVSQSTINSLVALVGPVLAPGTDSTTALKITKGDQATAVMTFDTTNARVGINKTPGAFDLDVNGAGNFGTSITDPVLNGGTAAASTLTLKATSGVGAGSEYVDIIGGNNGGQRLGRFTNTVNGQSSGLSIGPAGNASNGIQLAATSTFGIKGNIAIDRTITAATAGTDLSLTAGAAVSGGTDIAGGNVLINAGIGTGASGSNIQFLLSIPGASGTTDNAVVQQALLNSTGLRIMSTIAVPAGGVTGQGFKFSSTNQFGIFWGSGVPTLSAAQGSLYLRTDGSSTSTRLYINTNGSTGWTNVVTAA